MASFNGHDFLERGDAGYNVPGWDSSYSAVVKIIPGGSPVVQSIGADAQRLAMPIRCTASELDDLRGDADGDSHTLAWSGGSDSALLEKIAPPLEVRPGVDLYFTTLNFIKV